MMWLIRTIVLLALVNIVLCRVPPLEDLERTNSSAAQTFGKTLSNSKDVPFSWRNIDSIFAFGDSYTFIQGTEGHTNFRWVSKRNIHLNLVDDSFNHRLTTIVSSGTQ